jgi:hypothetical protein
MRVWHRTRACIRKMCSRGVFQGTSRTRPSPATRLPLELVERIISHLSYDTPSLLVCCLTCYSWYITAVPYLHHTIITPPHFVKGKEEPWWPKCFQGMYKLGLLPLVSRVQVQGSSQISILAGPPTFSPKLFDRHILRQFSALANVQELGIDYLDIPSFMPEIRRYFGHFLPTVRSLALREPKGSCRQIVFFIGSFQHLEDLKLLYNVFHTQEELPDDITIIPLFTPPLRGRLTMTHFTRVRILEDMISLFGGLRFRYMDLLDVVGMPRLLGACAGTLETLRFHPDGLRGEEFVL